MFASADLVRRIESAETELLVACATAVRRRSGLAGEARRHDVLIDRLSPECGGVAAWTGDGSPLNKVAGLGFGARPIDDDELAAIEASFACRGAPVQVELSTHAEPGLAQRLIERGYRLVGFEDVLGLELPAVAVDGAPRAGLGVEPSDEDSLDDWLDVVVAGFAAPDTQGVASHESFPEELLRSLLVEMVTADGFRRYLVRRDGEPAAGGSMRVTGDVAQLCGAATLPAHRRCGAQTALLAHRLDEAHRAGCTLAVVTTQPGSKSQQNVHRRGFSLLYPRAVFVREAETS